jgi:RNA polymerase sigma-70 factor (ECF subfamily)
MSTSRFIADLRAGRDVRAAQEGLYRVVRGELLARIEKKLPAAIVSRVDPEDVLHTAFMKALGHLDAFRGEHEGSFVAWVYRIAKNYVLDITDRRSVGAIHFAHTEGRPGVRASELAGPRAAGASTLGRAELIQSLLARLSEKDAELIRLRQIGGYSFEEMAEASGSTPGAVQRAYARAWGRLCELARDTEDREP